MRTLIRAAAAAMALSLLLSGAVLAKGERFTAVIGPIDPTDPGTPMQVPVQLMVDGKAIEGNGPGFYLVFSEVTEGATIRIEAPLVYDPATKGYIATVALPHAGRWQIDGGIGNLGGGEPFGRIDGTRNVIVPEGPAAPVASPESPAARPLLDVLSLLVGAVTASALWLLGIGGLLLRRRRAATEAAPATLGRRVAA